MSELTPAAIYEIFIDLCKQRLHLVISFNSGESQDISILFRKHKSIFSSCIEINFRVREQRIPCKRVRIKWFVENLSIISLCLLLKQKWPEDALKRSAEFMFEEINATRQTKKNISKTGMSIYEKAL